MRVTDGTVVNQQIQELPKCTMEEDKLETQDWEERTKLIDFHAEGQYKGIDGKLYRMVAEYAEDSTKVFPKVLVTVTDESGNVSSYHVDIRKVDTEKATEIEMFALCSHADTKRGNYKDIPENTVSSWESLLFYREMAEKKEGGQQDELLAVTVEETTYNWRGMMAGIEEAYMEEGTYDQYLHVNRMKDMLDYYSRFEGRPDAFENPFHAIRDYEFIGILTLEDIDYNIHIYDKQKKIECVDLKLPGECNVLWNGELSDDEYDRVMEIIRNLCKDSEYNGGYHGSYQTLLTDVSFWEDVVSGESQLEDYETYIRELKRQYQSDAMFHNCPESVRIAWKQAEEAAGFSALGVNKDTKEIEFISEYLRMLMERMKKGEDAHLLGMTTESAIKMAKEAIERLETMDFDEMAAASRRLKRKELNFYYRFLENLDPTQKFDPVELLLKDTM